ncbi:hypothetical protein [Robiginitalea marina]|uniref:Nuclear transport factor 2 family protein n=1 Tax=Robiginitalea marina TaxID=2954105 RepID=A0ABT1B1B5_9FLAO|nr:hypothetical protein [Robiginitalea marina]MCO5726078.1 hypothetical protein [Robiginitalea marina]
MKKPIALLILLALGCAPQPEKVSEAEAIRVVEGFFEALDVDNDDPGLLDRYTTADFLIYEASKKMTKAEFVEFASGSPALETDWELSDFRVSTDYNSAHVSLFNRGTFVGQVDSVKLRLNLEWLESAYLVKENDSLKIKFYFSDNVGRSTDTIQ